MRKLAALSALFSLVDVITFVPDWSLNGSGLLHCIWEGCFDYIRHERDASETTLYDGNRLAGEGSY